MKRSQYGIITNKRFARRCNSEELQKYSAYGPYKAECSQEIARRAKKRAKKDSNAGL